METPNQVRGIWPEERFEKEQCAEPNVLRLFRLHFYLTLTYKCRSINSRFAHFLLAIHITASVKNKPRSVTTEVSIVKIQLREREEEKSYEF
jgi:hypothetical protein